MTDAGNEYSSKIETMARSFDVFHDIVPPTQRHGEVLKLLATKTENHCRGDGQRIS